MGLEGVEYSQRMESFSQLGPLLCDGDYSVGGPLPMDKGTTSHTPSLSAAPQCTSSLDLDFEAQLQILLQAQALLKKNELYLKIDQALRDVQNFRPCIQTLPQTADEDDLVTSWHRDAAVRNLRFLNIFYGYGPSSFALAVNLLDRVLGKVKAHPKYLSCIAMSCFYIAIKNQDSDVHVASPAELVKLSQCGGTDVDLLRMEHLVLEKLSGQVRCVNPLTFVNIFAQVLASKQPCFENPAILNAIIAKLDILMCQFEFAKFRAETLALALLSCAIQDMDLLSNMDVFSTVIELQYHCQISDYEFLGCRGLILDFLAAYCSAPARVPRLRLVWSVSRRTLSKMKPSTRILLDLEPIMEDEVDEDSGESDDAGRFDSENENESGRKENNNYLIRPHPEILRAMAEERSAKQRALQENAPNHPISAMGSSSSLEDTCSELSFISLHSKENNDDSNM